MALPHSGEGARVGPMMSASKMLGPVLHTFDSPTL